MHHLPLVLSPIRLPSHDCCPGLSTPSCARPMPKGRDADRVEAELSSLRGARQQQITEPPALSSLSSTSCPAHQPSQGQVLSRLPCGTWHSPARVPGAVPGLKAPAHPCLVLCKTPRPNTQLLYIWMWGWWGLGTQLSHWGLGLQVIPGPSHLQLPSDNFRSCAWPGSLETHRCIP